MNHPPRRPQFLLLVALLAVLSIGGAGAALAAGTTVTLKLKGEYTKVHRTACHRLKEFRVFHRHSTVEFKGLVTPAPAGHFPVRLKIERCVNGRFRTYTDRFTTGKKLTGEYKGFFSAAPLAPRSHGRRAIVYYDARAYVTGGHSEHKYFAVTN
ncbi:MAG TPA: hypothetical protein VF781_12615 [Solirubrobacteraceae bacterium]